jgi:hypothetical protein
MTVKRLKQAELVKIHIDAIYFEEVRSGGGLEN